MVGIENIKAALGVAIHFGNGVDKSLADDKVNLTDIQNFVGLIPELIPGIRAIGQLGPEIKDLDSSEREELKAYIKVEFDLTDDVLEAKLEEGLDALEALGNAALKSIVLFKSFKKKE